MKNRYTTEELQHIKMSMQVFYQTTNLPCILIDNLGQAVHEEGKASLYCKRMQEIPETSHHCMPAHHHLGIQSERLGEAYIAYCPSGLVHYAAAIKIGVVYKGAIIAGPIHMSEPDLYETEQFLDKHNLSNNQKKLLLEYYQRPVMVSPTTARYHLQLLDLMVKEIVDDTRRGLEQKKALYDEQRKINEAVQELKGMESISAVSGNEYPIQLEKALSGAIIKGDEKQAKAILNEILGFVFFKYMGKNKRIISRSIELIVIMSRAAIEGGANSEKVEEITEDIYFKAMASDEIETICLWLLDTLEKLIHVVFPINVDKENNLGVLRKAITFMNQNIHENISLEDVATAINLSPTYFSRFFKKEMDMTYVEYLTKIRIEESKKYLVDSNESLSDIAARFKFSDQSYFSRVFKKYEGITPGKYRKMF